MAGALLPGDAVHVVGGSAVQWVANDTSKPVRGREGEEEEGEEGSGGEEGEEVEEAVEGQEGTRARARW